MSDINIPAYRVLLRHSVYGWQVVDVDVTKAGANVRFDIWRELTDGLVNLRLTHLVSTSQGTGILREYIVPAPENFLTQTKGE